MDNNYNAKVLEVEELYEQNHKMDE